MGANYKFLRNMYDMSERKVHGKWKWVCDSSAEIISICMQVNELTSMRDRCLNGFLSRGGGGVKTLLRMSCYVQARDLAVSM